MWDFPQYTSRERAFSFSRDALAMMEAGARTREGARMGAGARKGAGARTGAQASRKALRILCKSSSEYLRVLVIAGALVTGSFAPEGLAG